MDEPDWAFFWRTTEGNEIPDWEWRCGPRKYRLYVLACFQGLIPFLLDQRSRDAFEVAESYADGLVTAKELQTARGIAEFAAWEMENELVIPIEPGPDVPAIAEFAAWEMENEADFTERQRRAANIASMVAFSDSEIMDPNIPIISYVFDVIGRRGEGEVRWNIWLDVYGPAEPPSINPEWLTSDVLTLATGIYAEKAFDRLPILADALQDAGCDCDDLLSHLRSDGPHVRGCWALDLVLGQS